MASGNRPLSPHLQVYRPQITSILSILHRMTGVGLTLAVLLFTYWISAASYGPEAFERAQSYLGSWFGRLVLFGLAYSLFFHLLNGIRHLVWDAGWGYEMPTLNITGWVVFLTAGVLTIITFLAGYAVRGGL